MNRISILVAVLVGCALWGGRAEAQLGRGTMRFSLDGDMLSVGGVKRDPDGPGFSSKATVVSFGPNQLGNVRAGSALPTPIALGFGYVLQPEFILGVRAALGYDVVMPDGAQFNTRYLGLALQPGFTWVPLGNKTKLALSGAPIFQIQRAKTDNSPKDRILLGGFSLGVGALIFVRNDLSADIGFHFEGRFGNDNNPDVHIRDLRGVIRLGVSFWR